MKLEISVAEVREVFKELQAQPGKLFWRTSLETALGDLATLVAPKTLVLCEGRPAGTRGVPINAEFDAQCYRAIFAKEYPDTDFISVGNASDVVTDRLQVATSIAALVPGTQLIRVIDRDDRSEQEIEDCQAHPL